MIGYNDVQTKAFGIHFFVQRDSAYDTIGTVIPYSASKWNSGAISYTTGIFTAPFSGRYQFSFNALSSEKGDATNVYLRVNGKIFGFAHAKSALSNLPLVATLDLKTKDKVDVYLGSGSISYRNYSGAYFSGILVEEDVVTQAI